MKSKKVIKAQVQPVVMHILHLTLKKKWFDMIVSGIKREEYREMKSYWNKRLNRKYDAISFRNGYTSDSPMVIVELLKVQTGIGNIEWGAPDGKRVWILSLGKIIEA